MSQLNSIILQNNTFQVILMTDGATSYTVFLYNSMNWGDDDDTVIGFNDGDRFSTQQCFSAFSTVRNLSASSNVNISGVYVFSSDSVLGECVCSYIVYQCFLLTYTLPQCRACIIVM